MVLWEAILARATDGPHSFRSGTIISFDFRKGDDLAARCVDARVPRIRKALLDQRRNIE
jgi:hypothetical protein